MRLLGLVIGGLLAVAAGAVPQPRAEVVWEGVRISYDIPYGPRGDAPGEGAGYKSPMTGRHPNGHPIHSHRSGQFFDLIVDAKTPPAPTAPVYVNLHGGAWSQPFDKDGESFLFFRQLVQRGFVVVNANYQLQNDVTFGSPAAVRRAGATFRDMLQDIDALGAFLKTNSLPQLGVTSSKCVLGGTSAGAHLALLYAYDQDNPDHLKMGLRHALRVGYAVDIVGPVDLAGEDFTAPFLKGKRPLGSWFNAETTDRFATLLGWLVDDDLRARVARNDLPGMQAVLGRYSPIQQVTPRTVPTILAYCRLFPFARTDGCVPTSSYYDLRDRLKAAGVPYAGDIRTFRAHGLLGERFTQWLVDRVVEFQQRGYLQ